MDTGADMTARAYGKLGVGIADLGMGIFVAQGQAELTQKMADAKEKVSQMYVKLETTTDPDEYDQIFQETWSQIESAEVKNGWAAQKYRQSVIAMKPVEQDALRIEKIKRIRSNHDDALAWAEAQYVRTGSEASRKSFEAMLSKQRQEGWKTQYEENTFLTIAEDKRKVKAHSDEQQNMSAFTYNNPEVVLSWKTAEDMQKVFPDALPTDLTWIQGIAKNAISLRKYREKGIDPYNTTTNWTLYNEDRELALNNRLTLKEIDEHTGPDGYSDKEASRLRGIVTRKGDSFKDFEDSKAAKLLKELTDDLGQRYTMPVGTIPVMREKGYRLLQDAINNAEKPLTDREKQELALRIFNGLQTEKISPTPESLLTPIEKAEELGESLDKAVAENRAYQRAKGAIKNKTYLYTAINPKTGERIGWDGTKWIPLQ